MKDSNLSPSEEVLIRLMTTAQASRQPLRDQAILAFVIDTNCNRDEVASLQAEQISFFDDGSGTARGFDGRTVTFNASTGRYLIRYMKELVIVTGPLWINDYGEKLHRGGIHDMVCRTIKRAGLTEQIHGYYDLHRILASVLASMSKS